MAVDRPDIKHVVDSLHEVSAGIDNRNFIAFRSQPLGNPLSDLTGTADDDFHGGAP